MKSIFNTLKDGSSIERISLISNLCTIVGASVIGVISPTFLGVSLNELEHRIYLAIWGILCIAFLLVILAGILMLSDVIAKMKFKTIYHLLLKTALFLVYLVIVFTTLLAYISWSTSFT